MKNMKFYIYSSNIAIFIFSCIFVYIGLTKEIWVLVLLGAVLAIYSILRLLQMRKAWKSQDISVQDDE